MSRKSREDQKGFILADKDIYSFDESAYKEKREEFDKKVLERINEIIKKEKVAVCFDKVDRLARNVFDKRVAYLYQLALEGKIELHFVSEKRGQSPFMIQYADAATAKKCSGWVHIPRI